MTPAIALLSPIVAGAWRLADWAWTPLQRLRWIEGNVALGITSFDHADIYGQYTVEALFGEALALSPALRQRLQLVSKCGIRLPGAAQPGTLVKHYDTSAAHVRESVERSLRALRTDRLDLLLIHRPDALLDFDELAATFVRLHAEGKVLQFGASNFTPAQLAPLHRRHALATHQIELSPLHLAPLHDGTLDQCQDLGLRPMIWSPLAGGRIFSGDSPAAQRVRQVLAELQAELQVGWVTLLMAWLLRHPSQPHPVIGTRRLEMSREAVAALDLRLDAQQWYRLWRAGAGHEVA